MMKLKYSIGILALVFLVSLSMQASGETQYPPKPPLPSPDLTKPIPTVPTNPDGSPPVNVQPIDPRKGVWPTLNSCKINNDATSTHARAVTLTFDAVGAVYYRASENPNLSAVSWQPYAVSVPFTLSLISGTKIVYCQVRNGAQKDSEVKSDSIMLSITGK